MKHCKITQGQILFLFGSTHLFLQHPHFTEWPVFAECQIDIVTPIHPCPPPANTNSEATFRHLWTTMTPLAASFQTTRWSLHWPWACAAGEDGQRGREKTSAGRRRQGRQKSGGATEKARAKKKGGDVEVMGTRLLSGSAHGCCPLNLKEGEEQKVVLEAKDDEEKESEVDGKVEERVTQRVHETWWMRHKRESWATVWCARNQTRTILKRHYRRTNKGHSRVFSWCTRACSHASGLRPR